MKLDLGMSAGTIFLHVMAFAALWFFTWEAFILFLILYVVTGLGVTVGYHRLLTHGSFETYRPLRYFWALLGQLSAENTVVWWVAAHRKHHAFADQYGDPHSPIEGWWWSHMLWFLPKRDNYALIEKYAPDLWNDRGMRLLHYMFLPILIISAMLIYSLGTVYGMGLEFLMWGFFFRLVWVQHITWLVNSATHTWGYRNYRTNDRSTNLWWVALLSFGEGWHNNHHHTPVKARHGHRWYEIDFSYIVIYIMEKIGLVWNVRR